MFSNYATSLNVFNRLSSKEEVTLSWLRQNFGNVIKNAPLHKQNKLRVLSVGSGSGEPDSAILDELLKHQVTVHYTAIDPNPDQIAEFRKSVSEGPAFSQVKFALHVTTAQAFWESDACTGNYDVIFFVQSLYFLTPLDVTLETAGENLADDGIILSVTISSKEGYISVIENYKGILPSAGRVTAEVVGEAIGNMPFQVSREYFHFTLDIGPLFENSTDGNLLLDFLAHVDNFRHVSPKALVTDVLKQLRRSSHESRGRILSVEKMVVHIIKKKC